MAEEYILEKRPNTVKRQINCENCDDSFWAISKTAKYCSLDCYNEYQENNPPKHPLSSSEKKKNRDERHRLKAKKYSPKQSDTAKKYREENKQKLASAGRRYHLKRVYGITEEQYNELLEKQNQSCYICERHKDDLTRNLAVDHNHKTGEIRGLLCTNCNHRILARNNDPKLFRRAAQYLEETHTGWFVPPRKRKKRNK